MATLETDKNKHYYLLLDNYNILHILLTKMLDFYWYNLNNQKTLDIALWLITNLETYFDMLTLVSSIS